ncbi:MAG: type II CAAX prenyl endopeptidase Rce1 family protein [Candidatus Heimdallarchaeota archaeon]
MHLCKHCGRYTPAGRFCVFCGDKLPETKQCYQCYQEIPLWVGFCPFCGALNESISQTTSSSRIRKLIRKLRIVYPSLLIIFLLAASSLVQLIAGYLLAASGIVSTVIAPNTPEDGLFILLTVIIGTLVMIALLIRGIPISFDREKHHGLKFQTLFLLGILFGITVSVIEISVSLIELGLDLLELDQIQETPYDIFFLDQVNILLFIILAGLVGPIFEELVFRRYAISMLLIQLRSDEFVVITSALIFSLIHLPGDLQIGSLRYIILHLSVTFILGLILGMVYLRWGFSYAVVFHGAWNIFSVIISLASLADLEILVDTGIIVLIVTSFCGLLVGIFSKRRLLKERIRFLSRPSFADFPYILANLILFIMFEIVPMIMLLMIPSLITVGFVIFTELLALLAGPLVIRELKGSRAMRS